MLRQAFRIARRVGVVARAPQTVPVRKLFRVIDQGNCAYRERLGMTREKLEPGIRWKLPLIHKLTVIPLRELRSELKEVRATTKDNVHVVVTGSLYFRVTDPEKACYSIDDYYGAVVSLGHSSSRAVIGTFDYDKINSERQVLNNKLIEKIGGESNEKWGVECTRFEIQTFHPLSKEVEKHMELQMEAERKRRENELLVQAQIRTGEGHKQTAILKSEGELIAQKNQAEGKYIIAQRDADAKRYEMETMANAMGEQLGIISGKLGSADLASKYILEQIRLLNLGKVAEGPNNTIYLPADFAPVKVITDLLKPATIPATVA
ncbi:MAG: stomatin family protein [Hyperionvirus sp.]|uniref:Stomatin family protein n=1 Tax=Hyperionvirus sp. TaxID=2487770 RepID=A0A3G5A9A2_9VIRU|nr:MAG: stomatin family protein [Hyperionvirus sp.]